MYYAVYQVNGPIYGIGRSEKQAIEDALKWLPDGYDLSEEDLRGDRIDGSLRLARITASLFSHIQDEGDPEMYAEISRDLLGTPTEVW